MTSLDPPLNFGTARRVGITGALIGLAVAYAMYAILLVVAMNTWSYAAGWIFHVKLAPNIVLGAVATLATSWVVGKGAAVHILGRKRNYALVGVLSGLLTVWTGTLFGSLPGFFRDVSGVDAIFDYLLKPIIAVTAAGLIPIMLIGTWAGRKILLSGKTSTPMPGSGAHSSASQK